LKSRSLALLFVALKLAATVGLLWYILVHIDLADLRTGLDSKGIAIALLAGIAGIFTFGRRRDPDNLSLACLLITGSAVAVLLGADLYEFSWRYQLPALVTLPIAGAFGVTALSRHIQARRRTGTPGGAAPAETVDELATAGSEQVP
jgi:hypothetical protein